MVDFRKPDGPRYRSIRADDTLSPIVAILFTNLTESLASTAGGLCCLNVGEAGMSKIAKELDEACEAANREFKSKTGPITMGELRDQLARRLRVYAEFLERPIPELPK